MTKEFHLDVPLILQSDCYRDTNEKCGAACAQMVLHDVDPDRATTAGEQETLFARIQAPPSDTSAWYNPPQGISRVLNQDRPPDRRPDRGIDSLPPTVQEVFDSVPADPATTYEFTILGDSHPVYDPGLPRANDAEDQIEQIELLSRLLIRTVAIKGAAPIVAVREDNAHWVVVNGFQLQDDFDDANLRQRDRIQAIMIRNPLGRYTYRTIDCDSLPGREFEEITGHCCAMNPYLQDVISYETWVREYLFADWAQTFVAICDKSHQVMDPILDRIYSYAASKSRALSHPTPDPESQELRVTARHCPGEPEITPDEAVILAGRAIEEFDLSRLNRNVTPQQLMTPVKIKRLDRLDGGYYLVPAGVKDQVSGMIRISTTGKFNEATVWPRGHYTVPFEQRPEFKDLIYRPGGGLRGRKIRLTECGPALTITDVSRDQQTPYVWRPGPESFSAFRPFHNLRLTVEGLGSPISLFLPVDDYCLSEEDESGAVSLPSANYLQMLADCIKEKAGNTIGEVLALVNNRGNTLLVIYRSNRTKATVKAELETMTQIICECLKAHPRAGLTQFRIRAHDTNDFLTQRRGGGESVPLGTAPPSGGGGGGIPIGSCS
ncbi:MAG TPA: hypothetical protein VJ302_16280 [Blastocatellia bacterium]|nr:hypothetical protein [Blastocatellia bacterium]